MPLLDYKTLEWFRLANAGNYVEKRQWFYPFKTRFLNRFGTLEGWDFQTIEHECYRCNGTGLVDIETGGSQGMAFHRQFDCNHCRCGVYRTNHHWLQRWDLQGATYHIPEDPWPRPTEFREIEGRITHPQPENPNASRRAMLRLFLRHEPLLWVDYHKSAWKQKANWHQYRWQMRLFRLREKLDLFPIRKSYDPNSDVPF